jgi:pimeloyl-ACP methyl ester carboxylesterase
MKVTVNGVELSVQVEGEGPTVLLCHGFPELGYSWRHQVPALVDAGYRVVVPDMRGFGGSERPQAIEAYDVIELTGDLVGLLDWLEVPDAVFVGHDWGASTVWGAALIHPRRVRAVAGLSVPFAPRAAAPPLPTMRRRFGEDFYICWFQEPGVADAALARDVRRALTARSVWTAAWAAADEEADPRPRWLSEADLAYYVETFERTGFTGGLNYYRNIDRNWELTEPYAGRRIEQPSMFLTGDRDPVRSFMPPDHLEEWLTDLRVNAVIPGGHWIQQERPAEVNEALLGFLGELESSSVAGERRWRKRRAQGRR